eukprot:m.772326 g.772326  ORF g.772326 m.772326 type:complete len:679 (+) comp59097_c0_seq6:634-2670(+)
MTRCLLFRCVHLVLFAWRCVLRGQHFSCCWWTSMFLKNFRTKSTVNVRSSDKRKMRSDMSEQCPALSSADLDSIFPPKEDITMVKIYLASGESATIYCRGEQAVLFSAPHPTTTAPLLLPTLYTLWAHPNLLPAFTTTDFVIGKLQGGAELMLPGVIKPRQGPQGFGAFERGSPRVVNTIDARGVNIAPAAIGFTTISSAHFKSQTEFLEGELAGPCLHVLHCVGDFLWQFGTKMARPFILAPADAFETSDDEESSAQAQPGKTTAPSTEPDAGADIPEIPMIETLTISEGNEERDESDTFEVTELTTGTDAGKSQDALADEGAATHSDSEQEAVLPSLVAATTVPAQEEPPLFQDMDEVIKYSFVRALCSKVTKADLPILVSTFFSTHMLPSRPQGVELDVKKSSYKKIGKFLAAMQEAGAVVVKQLSEGVDSIVDLNRQTDIVREMKRRHPGITDEDAPEPVDPTQVRYSKKVVFRESFKPVALLRELFIDVQPYEEDGPTYTKEQLRDVLAKYIQARDLVDKTNKRVIVLDPLLCDALYAGDAEKPTHVMRDVLSKVFVAQAQPYYRLLLGNKLSPLKKGTPPKIQFLVERRTGSKLVTIVRNLEMYNIDLPEMAKDIQHSAATSATLVDVPGDHRGSKQLLVMGSLVDLISAYLEREYGLNATFMEVQDKSKKK